MRIVHCVSTTQSQAFWDAFNVMLPFGFLVKFTSHQLDTHEQANRNHRTMHQWGILTRKTRLPIKKKKGGARSKVLVNR